MRHPLPSPRIAANARRRPWALALLVAVVAPGPVAAAVPNVVTDIPAVHSLVAGVMGDAGTPALLLPKASSVHGYSMRPSDAAAIESADLVIYTSAALTPWLARAVPTLAPDALTLQLLALPDSVRLSFRSESRTARADDADADANSGDGDGHADDDEHVDGESHDHAGGIDPHAWLDPENARRWTSHIADALAALDPAHADAYAANAEALDAALVRTIADARAVLAPVRATPFVTYHDGYRYFERRFGLSSAGSISDSDAAPPGPAHLLELRDTIERLDVGCLLVEPRSSPKLVATVTEGRAVRAVELDPLGSDLEPGPALYPRLVERIAAAMAECLAPA